MRYDTGRHQPRQRSQSAYNSDHDDEFPYMDVLATIM